MTFFGKRFDYHEPIRVDQLVDIDVIVISHDHYDHLDYSSIKALNDNTKHYLVPLGVGAHLIAWGVDPGKITELDWGQSAEKLGIQFTATPARHFSGRGMLNRDKTLWASWVIKGRQKNIYFSGDSGYGPHFKDIGDQYGPFDFAMMECGQYNEKWEAIHMMPEQTVQASLDLRSKHTMPIHWGAFDLSLHTWTDPVDRLIKESESKGVPVSTPQLGTRFEIADHPTQSWWKMVP